MKRQILISPLILLFVAGFAAAATLNVDNISGPYFTIQSAIDNAVSGVDNVNVAPGTYFENIDFLGKEIDVHSSDVNNPANTIIDGGFNGSVVTFQNCGPGAELRGFTLRNGLADYGGGIECYNSSPTISDCNIVWNWANYYGGGVDLYFSDDVVIRDCIIRDNSASYGGGINCDYSSSTIHFCEISKNEADDAGSGISCWDSFGTIENCLIAENIVHHGVGAAIYLWNAGYEIGNCTIADNIDSANNFGGIYCDAREYAEPAIINSILWNNGDDLYNCYELVTYSCIEDKETGQGNIYEDPQFIGPYYLSSIAAGQLVDSNCIDAGSADADDPSIGLDQYTTTSNQAPDTGKVDMGYHQERILPVPSYRLFTSADVTDGNGTIDPCCPAGCWYDQYTVVDINAIPADANHRIWKWTVDNIDVLVNPLVPTSGLYTGNIYTVTMTDAVNDVNVTAYFEEKPERVLTIVLSGTGGRLIEPLARSGDYYCRDGDVVTIETRPNPGYVTHWIGTDDDYSIDPNNTVTMDGNKTVTVWFYEPQNRHVPGEYPSIQAAIHAAAGGDRVVVSEPPSDEFPGDAYYEINIDFHGKAITVTSERPDDPDCVAATVINCDLDRDGIGEGRAFIFQHGEGRRSVINGFTIINGSAVDDPNTPPDTEGTGKGYAHDDAPQGDVYKRRDVTNRYGFGEDLPSGQMLSQHGNGEDAKGGAIACFNDPHLGPASPTISNCVIKNSRAQGQSGEDASYIFDPHPDPEDPPKWRQWRGW